ncbi:hypothetical protein AB1K83_11745 [Sporosarcina sp. 179-K 3D1 HS]|uniref:hypothetical protein n=1 Tax=Sporosarcina sp. 179-K 3D1 HS TaxID=3232169 RepID=UPI00399F3FAE
MFNKKKELQAHSKFFNVAIISKIEISDEQYEKWTDEVMDTAGNVGSTTWMMREDWDAEQVKMLERRFPDVRLNETFFIVNEIISDDIQREVKELEKRHPWKKFFNMIPLTDYIDAEDRAVLNAAKTLACTNDLFEVKRFLLEQGSQENEN